MWAGRCVCGVILGQIVRKLIIRRSEYTGPRVMSDICSTLSISTHHVLLL